jgi:hypothetical protein
MACGSDIESRMKVDVFTLCDFAQAENGKLTVIGAFNRITTSRVPATHQLCAVAAALRFEQIEVGQKTFRLSIIDADGKPVMPVLQAPLNVHVNPGETVATCHLVLLIQQVVLPSFGEYSVDLAIDGRQEASTPLWVRPMANPPQLSLPGSSG